MSIFLQIQAGTPLFSNISVLLLFPIIEMLHIHITYTLLKKGRDKFSFTFEDELSVFYTT